MKNYILQAKLGNLITTQSIPARDTFSAKVLAARKISENYVADKRYAIGEITLKDPSSKVVWHLAEVVAEEKKGGK